MTLVRFLQETRAAVHRLALLTDATTVSRHSLSLRRSRRSGRCKRWYQLLVAQAERQATVSVWEDLHWADPSSLEFLTLLIEQIPTTKLLLVLTFRPEFTPPWKPRSHISQLVLNRLGQEAGRGDDREGRGEKSAAC